MLASSWFRAYKRLKRTVRRGGLNARVELVPLTALPPDLDVLVVPPSLQDAPEASPELRERLVSPPEELQQEFDRLVARLLGEGRLEYANAPARALAVHRGFRPVADRARLAD